MSGKQFQFALVFRADVAAGKAGLTDLSGTMDKVSAAGEKAAATARKQATDLQALAAATVQAISGQDQLAAAQQRAAETRARALIAPLANPIPAVAPMQAAFRATQTAAGSLQATVAGLSVTIGDQAQEMVETANASRIYQSALDDIRASFNPLFAAARAYEQQLERIAEAEKIGAISAREAAAARVAAAERLAPAVQPGAMGQAGRVNPWTVNVGAQGFDIGTTALMGMNPVMIGVQQGGQLAGIAQAMGGGAKAAKEMAVGIMSIFNPTSLVIIGLTTLAAVGIQALMGLSEKTKTWDEHLADLDETLGRMKANLERVNNVRLSDTFGNMTDDVRGLAQGLLELDRAAELKSLEGVVKGFLEKEVAESWGQSFSRSLMAGMSLSGGGMASTATIGAESSQSANYAAMGAANSFEDFQARTAEIERLAKAGDIRGVTSELLDLQRAMAGGGAVSEMSDDLRNLLAGLAEAGIKTAEIEAIFNGSGRAEAQKRQIDQMVLGYQQEAELQAASLQFGSDAVELDRIRARHARDLLEIRLEEMGVERDSAEWVRAINALLGQQGAIEAANAEARRERIRDQEDQIAAIHRETALIGAGNAARTRANALAEADIEIRKRKLQGQEAEEERARAIAKAEAEIALEHRRAMRDVMVASTMDIYDARIAEERDPIIRAAIEAEKAYAQAFLETGDAALAAAEAERVRLKAVRDAERERRRALEDIATAGLMDTYDAQIAGERNPYARAAIEAEKEYARVLNETHDAIQAAASAERVRAKALSDIAREQQDLLRGQGESLQQLQLELALVGQTAEVRARVLALAQAERDIQRLGLSGDAAEQYRRNAALEVELTRQIEASADAWARVQSAGENAVDGILDKLREGDIAGAFEELAAEIEKGLFDLAIRNPLKNALFGTNLGTIQDVGGLGGIWAKLTGKNGVDETALATQAAMPVGTMSVMATTVMIGGIGAQAFLSGMSGPGMVGPGGVAGFAGSAGASSFGGSLAGSGDVQSMMWSFFAGKGLQPHQIAAIMGHANAESGFDPFAKGDRINGQYTSFGLFQHHKERADGLLAATGGIGGLGNVNAQLEFVWKELLTSENGVLQKLLASTDVQQATAAFAGYERPQGWTAANPYGSHNWEGRLGAAEAALAKFGSTATAATGELGTLGNGFGVFGNALSQGLQGLATGGAQGGIGGFLGTLATGIASALGIPGFASGGDHVGGWRIVGENGPEIEATGAARIFNAAQTRNILSRPSALEGGGGPAPVIQLQPVLVNNTGRPVQMEVEETTDARGQRQQRYIISDLTGEGLATPGGKGQQTMRNTYGLSRASRRRWS